MNECSVSYVQSAINQHRVTKAFSRKTLNELAPRWDRPYLAMVDGKPVLRADWDIILYSRHSVVFIDINAFPQGGGSNPLRMLAMIAVMAIAVYTQQYYLLSTGSAFMAGAAGAAVMFGGMMLVNMALPPPTTSISSSNTPAASPTYSLQAQGNYARIDEAIPEHFGRHEAFFDFAAMPYSEAHGNEIFLYQLFSVGRGEYDIEVIKIEDTNISNFEDIEYEIIPPGGSVSLFPANVVTSDEVTGQKLEYDVYSNVAVAVPEGQQAEYIGYDFVAPRGIFYANDNGSLSSQTITADLEYQEIDNDGVAIGSWVVGRSVSYSAATTTPQRYSEKVPVPAGRYQVRVKRTNVEQTDTRYGHELDWAGLRAYINDDRQYGDVTLIAMIMRASSQLSSQASRKVNGIATRKLYVWENGDWSATKQPTRSIAWAAAYACQQVGLSDAEYDLPHLIYLESTAWGPRGDECNGRVDSFAPFRQVLNRILSAGRAKAYEQGGIVRFWRDQQETMAVCHFSMLNIVRGSFGIQLLMPTTETADTVDAWYYDEAVWKRRKVRCTLPDSSAETPAKLETSFITKRDQATREGIYTAATNKYRREIVRFSTEMEGFIPSLGDLISIQHDMPAWGQSGEAVAVSQAGNLLLNSEDFEVLTLNGVNPFGAGSVVNATVAPDGKTTADFISEDTSNSSHRISVALGFDVEDGYVGTFSLFAKKGTRTAVFPWMMLKDDNFAYGDFVNLNDGTTNPYGSTSGYTTTVEEYPDGWWRISISGSVGAGSSYPRFYISISNSTLFRIYYGDGVSGLYVWGRQFYEGSEMVEYLKTTTSEVQKTIMATSEPLTWDDELQHYIGLRKKDGSLFGPVPVSRAISADNLLIIDEPVPFEIYTGSEYERTHYSFGWADTWSQYAKVLAVKPRDGYRVDIEAFTEDSNVHTAENGITVPSVQTSQLPGYQTRPLVEGLIVKSSPADVDVMLLSWRPSPWAEYYLIEQSADGIAWTKSGESGSANYSDRAIYGSSTLVRVCAVGMTTGPWEQLSFGGAGDYFWNAVDSTLMWDADDTTLMWS